MPINSIHIGDRIRKELGDVSALAKSIEDVGLLHPVMIDRRGHLVAGARRLAALRKLQWTKVPVTVAADLAEALLLMAEGDENVQREPFAPVEAESYQRQLIEMYEPEAKAAKAHGRTA